MGEVRVLLFSVLREKVGRPVLNVTVPERCDSETLLDIMAEMYPAVVAYRTVTRVAVNQTYATPDTPIQHGDEVALITPVSGG